MASLPTYPYLPLNSLTEAALGKLSGGQRVPVFIFESPEPVMAELQTAANRVRKAKPAEQKWVVAPLVRRTSPPGEALVLGRGSRCDVLLPFETVSRAHAYLAEPAPGEYLIYDNHSANGIILNGDLIPQDRWVALPDDASLMFGDLEISFLHHDSLFAELRSREHAEGAAAK